MALFKIQKKPFNNTPEKRSKSTIHSGVNQLPAIVNSFSPTGQKLLVISKRKT